MGADEVYRPSWFDEAYRTSWSDEVYRPGWFDEVHRPSWFAFETTTQFLEFIGPEIQCAQRYISYALILLIIISIKLH
jgi:hypothetical protein